MNNYDFLNKKLIRSFDWNDIKADRSMEEEVCINGREYTKKGIATASTVVGNLYLINDQSVKRNKYVLMVGIARQHPCDLKVTRNEGMEVANLNALNTPVMCIEVDHEVDWEEFSMLAEWYVAFQTPKFVKTKEEIKNKSYDVKYPEDKDAFALYSSN